MIDGAIIFPLHHQCPDQPGVTHCQRNHCSQITPALDQIPDPATDVILLVTQLGDHRPGPMDQAHAQIFITPFGNPAQAYMATGRVLPRHQPQPGRKLTTVLE